MKRLKAVDLFCGAGGTSSGFLKACAERRRAVDLVAVNHWDTAINTHSLNHPQVKHLCEPVENIHPRELMPGGRLDVLMASCECRFHSNARGGGPCNPQSRAQPWQIVRWATDINVQDIMMENVREFRNWGPLNLRTKRPIQRRKGEYFRAFVNALIGLGYNVEFRIQCCADFGDATSRERLILMARKGEPVVWPEATHGPGRDKPFKTAREIIDWTIKGKSIFDRKKPLSKNTLARLEAGLRKFGGANAEPFLILLNGTKREQIEASALSLDASLPTVTCSGHLKLCEPFIMNYHGSHSGRKDGAQRNGDLEKPLPTQDTSNRFALVEPFIQHLTHHGPHESRCHSIHETLPTVTGAHRGEMALIEPFLIQTDQTGGNGACIHNTDKGLPTVVSKQNLLLVEPLILKYYSNGFNCKPVSVVLDTVTCRDRFMLVEFESGKTVAEIGIRTRMLQPHELAASHSFPAGYQFTGSKEDQTKQIGNSVPVELACAHAKVLI